MAAVVDTMSRDLGALCPGTAVVDQPSGAEVNSLPPVIRLISGQPRSAASAPLVIASAGLLKRGAVAWVQVSLPETIEVAGMKALPWMMATTSFDGSSSTTYQPGTVIVICDNTREIALGEDTPVVRIPHSIKSLSRLGRVTRTRGTKGQTRALPAVRAEPPREARAGRR